MRALMLIVAIFIVLAKSWSLSFFHHGLQLERISKPFTAHRTSFRSIREPCGNDETDYVWDPKLFPKLDPSEDYYHVLEVSPTASDSALKRSYYKLVIRFHPDNKTSKADKDLANRQMMIINSAYSVLKDPIKRSKYDRTRRHKPTISTDLSPQTKSEPKQPSSKARSTLNEDFDNIIVSFDEFKLFLDDIYEKEFPPDSMFVKDLFHRFETEKEFRENIIRNGDFKNSRQMQSQVHENKKMSDSTSFALHEEDIFSRGDGSIESLKSYLQSLKRRKIRKEDALRADKRDWGEVTDENLIRSRLHAIDEVRDIMQEIDRVQDEILSLEFRDYDDKQKYREECEYWKDKQERDDLQYRNYRESHNSVRSLDGESSPQVQPQRISDEKKKVGFWGDDGDYGPRWKEDQKKRRGG